MWDSLTQGGFPNVVEQEQLVAMHHRFLSSTVTALDSRVDELESSLQIILDHLEVEDADKLLSKQNNYDEERPTQTRPRPLKTKTLSSMFE